MLLNFYHSKKVLPTKVIYKIVSPVYCINKYIFLLWSNHQLQSMSMLFIIQIMIYIVFAYEMDYLIIYNHVRNRFFFIFDIKENLV